MKTIQSEGGPLIAIDWMHLHRWAGIAGKSFVGDASSFETDYEAAGDLIDGRTHPPCSVSKITGMGVTGFLISEPYETAILDFDDEAIYLAQIICGDPEWHFDRVQKGYFDKAKYNKEQFVDFSSSAGHYVLFDAAYSSEHIGDDCLIFYLKGGYYVVDSALYEPDDRTNLMLCKIVRVSAALLQA